MKPKSRSYLEEPISPKFKVIILCEREITAFLEMTIWTCKITSSRMIYRSDHTIAQIILFASEHDNFDQKIPILGNLAVERRPGIAVVPNHHIPAINALANGHGHR